MKLLILKKLTIFAAIITCAMSSNIVFADNLPPVALIEIQSGTTEGTVPFSINVDGTNSHDPENQALSFYWKFPDGRTFNTKNPRSYRFEEAGNFQIVLTVTDPQGLSHTANLTIIAYPKIKKSGTNNKNNSNLPNGDPSDNIIINEVMPNPEGKDSGNEWIELYNNDNKDINLNNWKIESGGKSYNISGTISKKNHLLINNVPLKNSDNSLILKDFNSKQIAEIHYESAPEGQSFSLINNEYIWGKPTPNQANPQFNKIKGLVEKAPDDNHDYFILNNTKIHLDEHFDHQLATTLIQTDNDLIATVEQIENQFFLRELEIISPPPTNTSNSKTTNLRYYLLIPIGLTAYLSSRFLNF